MIHAGPAMVDVSQIGLSGRKAQNALGAAHITANKNQIPFDERPPSQTSGIRLGAAALTTRGMGPDEMKRIAAWIDRVLDAPDEEENVRRVGAEVAELTGSFPLFAWSPAEANARTIDLVKRGGAR